MIVRESIQGFQRGLEPKKSMNIGLEQQIKNWADEFGNRGEYPDGQWLIFDILEDTELDKETTEKWIKFLLSKDYPWDEEEWNMMMDQDIEVLEYLPNGFLRKLDEIEIKKEYNNFSIKAHEWTSFVDYFDLYSGNIDEDFLTDVLSGNAFKYFEPNDPESYNGSEVIWFIEQNKSKFNVLDDLITEYINQGGDTEKIDDYRDMLDDIFENEEMDALKWALQTAFTNMIAIEDESRAYKEIKNAIENHFELSNPDWKEIGDHFYLISEISQEGTKKIFNVKYDNVGKIKYNAPDDYGGTWSMETFNEELSNKLADL